MKISHSLVTLGLAALVSACGGGGGGTPASSATVSTGVFIDSPVSGIDFTTATQSGKTNAKGEFSYVAGESVTFSIGRIQFPPVAANATVTPLDIAKTTDINNQVVSNILVFLQSLDEDGNLANGIAIPTAAAAKATTAIDFNVTPTLFAANSAVTGLVANSGSVTKTLIAESVAKAHFQNTLDGTVGTPKVNVAPVANAGTVQNVVTGTVVTLDGSTSSDANNDTLTYGWTLTTKPTGSVAVLSSTTSAKPTFTADVAGSYVASLVVNDGTINSTVSTVTVTASAANAAPVANAGPAQNVVIGATVTLNGAASSDANGDALTYAWSLTSKPAGSSATLANVTAVAPTFVVDVEGIYVATLMVNDGKLGSAASTNTVTAVAADTGSSSGGSTSFASCPILTSATTFYGVTPEGGVGTWTFDIANLTSHYVMGASTGSTALSLDVASCSYTSSSTGVLRTAFASASSDLAVSAATVAGVNSAALLMASPETVLANAAGTYNLMILENQHPVGGSITRTSTFATLQVDTAGAWSLCPGVSHSSTCDGRTTGSLATNAGNGFNLVSGNHTLGRVFVKANGSKKVMIVAFHDTTQATTTVSGMWVGATNEIFVSGVNDGVYVTNTNEQSTSLLTLSGLTVKPNARPTAAAIVPNQPVQGVFDIVTGDSVAGVLVNDIGIVSSLGIYADVAKINSPSTGFIRFGVKSLSQ